MLGPGAASVPPDLAGLLVTQPGRALTTEELRRIDEFLMLGHRTVVVVAGAVNVRAHDPAMKAQLDTRGLEKLLAPYGIEMRVEAILDPARSFSVPVVLASGEQVLYRAPGIVLAARGDGLHATFPAFFRIPELALPFASTLVAHPDRQPAARLRVVARSTAQAWVDPSSGLELKPSADGQPRGEQGERAIAIALEGRMASAFDSPASPEAAGTRPTSRGPSRLLVISASQLFANPFARAANPPEARAPASPGAAPRAANRAVELEQAAADDLRSLAWPYAREHLPSTVLALIEILDWMVLDDDLLSCAEEIVRR
jgi:hypothetical protein